LEGYKGYRVISPEELYNDSDRKSIVICTTKYWNEVRNLLLSNGIMAEDIIDVRQYFCCGTGDEYFYEDFIKYADEEIFIDAGCYDLETSVDLSRICHGLKKIYAFEPDKDNFEKCMKKFEKEKENLPETVILPYGTWNCETELHFDATADGCSHICDGDTVIKTATIDDVVSKQDRVTFIKMDVEGAELESLQGAQEIIKRDKPKLAICIYHKPEDMLTLPLYIKSLVPEYRFYLRSYSNAENEMVLYAVL
jgi:FkbM family methyltransferase